MRDYIEKAKHYLMYTYLMIVPLASSVGRTNRDSQENMYQYLTITILSMFIGNIWLTSFVILNLVSYIHAGEAVGSMQVLNIVFGCLLYRFTKSYIKKRDLSVYFKAVLWLTFASLVLAIFQTLNLDPMFTPQDGAGQPMQGTNGLPTGFFGINMAHGIFLTLAACIISLFNPILALFLAIPIAMLRSSTMFMAFGIATSFICYFRFRKWFKWVVGVMAIFAVVGTLHDQRNDPGTFTARFPMWHMSMRMLLTSPDKIIGFGPDSFRNTGPGKEFTFASDDNRNVGVILHRPDGAEHFQYYVPNRDPERLKKLTQDGPPNQRLANWDDPHSEFIKILFQYGVIGFLLLIGFTRWLVLRFYFARKTPEVITLAACILVYYVSSFAHFPFGLARTAYLFPIILAAFDARTEEYAP